MHRTPSGDRRQALQKAAPAPAARREAQRLQGEADAALAEAQALRLAVDGSTLVKHALNLLAQRSHAPSLNPSHLGVELALQGILQIDDLDEMGPGQQSRQCLDYPVIVEDLGKMDRFFALSGG
jgi:hypothetical protein